MAVTDTYREMHNGEMIELFTKLHNLKDYKKKIEDDIKILEKKYKPMVEKSNEDLFFELPDGLKFSIKISTRIGSLDSNKLDVVLREEDPDEGGLLFNPDTNQVKVINTTGLFIWQQCGVARTMTEIVTEVQKGFDEVPLEQVAADVQEFMDGMLASGFIGTLEKAGE